MDLDGEDYEYYDEEYDLEKDSKAEIDELYKISMKLNTRRRKPSDEEEESQSMKED